MKYLLSLYFIVIAAAQIAPAQAIADSPEAFLAEGTDPGPPPTTTTTSTTSTTTTLPVISRCPDGIAGAETGSRSGYDYWAFEDKAFCSDTNWGKTTKLYCFENPWVNVSSKHRTDWEDISEVSYEKDGLMDVLENGVSWNDPSWKKRAAAVTGAAAEHPDTCYICGCFRAEGCFAPGVKITMADGSLRKIEDVRAGDMVRNVKTGAAVKVGKVIEGPETLPLIRFGFDGATVTTSQAHPVLTATGLKPANQLKKGDTVFDAQGNPHPVTILETLPLEEGQRVINVNLDAASSDTDQRLIVSDGIITGDIVLQGLLKERK